MAKNYASPAGKAVWPKISKPETKFNPEGTYETKLRLDAEEGGKFLQHIQQIHEEHHDLEQKKQGKTVKKHPLSITHVEEDGAPTGEIEFKFTLKAQAGKPGAKWAQRPVIFDSRGGMIKPDDISIGSGSTIKVGYDINPWFSPALGAGITLLLKSVQVIDLKEFGGSDFDSFGFGKVDGFISEHKEDTASDDPAPQHDSDF